MKKLILSVILAFSFLLSGLGSISVKAENLTLGKDIKKELENVDLTQFELTSKTDVITVSEVGFGTNDYKLIVYVYNSEKVKLSKISQSNVINMAVRYDEDLNAKAYANFKLEYISSTEDDSIYKFAVIDTYSTLKLLAEDINTKHSKRRYDIAGVQLLKYGDRLAKDYKVSKSYVFSGEDSTLTVNEFETVELEVHPVWYRTSSSDVGANHQHQLNAVYFSVPDKYLNDGYKLNKVKAEFYEYKTEAVIVVENKDLHSKLNAYKGVNVTEHKSDIPMLYYNQKTLSGDYTTHTYQWAYNTKESGSFVGYAPLEKTEKLTFLFNKPTTEKVTSKELTDYIYNYSSSSDKGYLPIKNGQISADLFLDTVDNGRTRGYNCVEISADETYDLMNYESNHGFFDKLFDFGFWATLTGKTPIDESVTGIKAIECVSDKQVANSELISSELLIDKDLVEDFELFYKESKQENRDTYIFRFASTDYKAYPIDNPNDNDNKLGYVAWETVFLDFDIIQLEFNNGNHNLVIPVVASPIDIIPSITPPPVYNNNWIWWMVVVILCSVGGIILYRLLKENK